MVYQPFSSYQKDIIDHHSQCTHYGKTMDSTLCGLKKSSDFPKKTPIQTTFIGKIDAFYGFLWFLVKNNPNKNPSRETSRPSDVRPRSEALESLDRCHCGLVPLCDLHGAGWRGEWDGDPGTRPGQCQQKNVENHGKLQNHHLLWINITQKKLCKINMFNR